MHFHDDFTDMRQQKLQETNARQDVSLPLCQSETVEKVGPAWRKYQSNVLTLLFSLHYCNTYCRAAVRCSYAWFLQHYLFIQLCGWEGCRRLRAPFQFINDWSDHTQQRRINSLLYRLSPGTGAKFGSFCDHLFVPVLNLEKTKLSL